MAKKFFNKKVYNKRKNIISIVIISISVIGIIASFIITTMLNNRPPEDAVIKVKNIVYVDIHTKIPDSELFFEELKNVDEEKIKIETDKINIEKVDTYSIEVKVYNKKYTVDVIVQDTEVPEFTTKDVNINAGESYSAEDFVESCTDNSKEECKIEFLSDGVNQDGSKVDFSNYTDKGSYEIKLIASDTSGNQIEKTAKLIIDSGTSTTTCKFGDLNYDKEHTLAYIVGTSNCAIDLNLYQNEEIRKPVIDIAESETTKLKTDINNISGLSENLTINREINAILNVAGGGVVGYSLFIEVAESNGDIVVSYNLDLDGNRIFTENPHNLK